MPSGVYPRKPRTKAPRAYRKRRAPPSGRMAVLIHLERAMLLINEGLRDGAELRESDCEVKFALEEARRMSET